MSWPQNNKDATILDCLNDQPKCKSVIPVLYRTMMRYLRSGVVKSVQGSWTSSRPDLLNRTSLGTVRVVPDIPVSAQNVKADGSNIDGGVPHGISDSSLFRTSSKIDKDGVRRVRTNLNGSVIGVDINRCFTYYDDFDYPTHTRGIPLYYFGAKHYVNELIMDLFGPR